MPHTLHSIVLVLVLVLGIPGLAESRLGTVTTVAGSVNSSGPFDGSGPAARFLGPISVVYSPDNSLIIADHSGHAVRRLDLTTGNVSTVAGSIGSPGFSDGEGTNARFSYPGAIVLNREGSFGLLADSGNNAVRRIDKLTGVVMTLVGPPGYSGGSGVANLNNPLGITMDASGTSALIADTASHIIRMLSVSDATEFALAGQEAVPGYTDGAGTLAMFSSPHGVVATDSSMSSALILDSNNHAIRRIMISSGEVSTITGTLGQSGFADGMGTLAMLNYPVYAAVDSTKSFAVVTDRDNDVIRHLDLSTGTLTTIAGQALAPGSANGIGSNASFYGPSGVALVGPNAYVTDSLSNLLRMVVIVELELELASPPASGYVYPGSTYVAQLCCTGYAVSVAYMYQAFVPAGYQITNANLVYLSTESGYDYCLVRHRQFVPRYTDSSPQYDKTTAVISSYSGDVGPVMYGPVAGLWGTPVQFELYSDVSNSAFGGCRWTFNISACPVGYYCSSGLATPSQCPAGTYGAEVGLSSALCSGQCVEGYYCPAGSTNGTAVECPAGSYCPAGSDAPVPCPDGTYNPTSGVSDVAFCVGPCPCCPAGSTTLISGCSQSASPSPSPSQTASVPASWASIPTVAFGAPAQIAMSSDGSTIAVGEPSPVGSFVSLYNCDAGACTLFTVVNSSMANSSSFGASVALSSMGSSLFVGDPQAPSAVYGYGCIAAGCTLTDTLSPGETTGAGISLSIAANGTRVVMGATSASLSTCGAAYVFDCSDPRGPCVEESLLLVPDSFLPTCGGASFGNAVSLSADGTILAIGAPDWNSGQGIVFLYSCGLSGCSNVGNLTDPDAEGSPKFGSSVAVTGTTSTARVFVGAEWGFSFLGKVIVYECVFATCSAVFALPGIVPFGSFGISIATSGDGTLLAVGSQALTAFYSRNADGTWVESQRVAAAGYSVAMASDGSRAAIYDTMAGNFYFGAPFSRSSPSSTPSQSSTQSRSVAPTSSVSPTRTQALTASSTRSMTPSASPPTAWVLVGTSYVSRNSQIALNGNGSTLAVGLPASVGANVALYACAGSNCTATSTVRPSGFSMDFGSAVALSSSGSSLFVGDSAAGAAYGFACVVNCTLGAILSTPGQSGAGNAISASLTGTRIALGAKSSNSSCGAVYMFECAGAGAGPCNQTSVLTAPPIAGPCNALFGTSVSLAADGSSLAVGAPSYNDQAGAVFVFTCSASRCNSSTSLVNPTVGEKSVQFGACVVLTGTAASARVFVGAYLGSSSLGKVTVFQCTSWVCASAAELSPAPSSGHLYGQFGYSLSASADGALLAIGAPAASLTYFYSRATNGAWVQCYLVAAAGKSVSVSADGSYAAIQSPAGFYYGAPFPATPSRTPSQSLTRSQTRSHSPSQSVTRSRTPSQSVTASISASLSASSSGSASVSSSGTASASASQSGTPSTSATQTPSFSSTRTPSSTGTATRTASRTATSSQAATRSQSRSQAPSGTQSQVASSSQTQTLSVTSSATLSQTQSKTGSRTRTGSTTQSRTHSMSRTSSVTTSPTQTQSKSQTLSPSSTQSPSVSMTPSATQSPSTSSSATRTQTQSPSRTATRSSSGTASLSRTSSRTRTPSSTVTPSRTQATTTTQTSTATTSPSTSSTPSQTSSATSSRTPSATQTASVSGTSSQTATRSSSSTSSTSQSSTLSGTSSLTSSLSSTPSQLSTASMTATLSGTSTPSAASTASASPSATGSASSTPSWSSSGSATPSLARTASVTSSPTRSQSRSQTTTPGVSPTSTSTKTGSPSMTRSQSATRSGTKTQSTTRSTTASHTRTKTPSLTRTPSRSGTLSRSPSFSPTQSSSPSESPSETISSTASGASTPSGTQTPSVTSGLTRSVTPSASRTPSVTLTRSASASRSQTQSATASGSASQSVSASASGTASVSPSLSFTSSETRSPTLTITQSRSQSTSQSRTRSSTGTQSPSRTGTRSQSLTRSPSVTRSASQTTSRTGTISLSTTASALPTLSTTASSTQTPSVSTTGSLTRTGSATGTPSLTQTQSLTASLSGTRSDSSTASATCTRSLSGSASQGQSTSATSSQSQSQSRSETPSSTASGTLSQAASPSGTATATGSQGNSGTHSQAATASMTSSSTSSAAATPTQSHTQSLSQARTPSATQTATLTSSRSQPSTSSATSTSTQGSTRSGSGTATGTSSLTSSGSQSTTRSSTPTDSQSGTSTGSQSATPSSSTTRSPSSTPSPTTTRSSTDTASPSRTPSASGSPSGASTASVTLTASATQSPSVTASQTGTRTPTGSETTTATASKTASRTGTRSQSTSLTVTRSQTQTPSATRSASRTGSKTQSSSRTLTQSRSTTRTRSQSQSPSATGSASLTSSASSSSSGSPSQSETPSASSTPSQSSSASQSGSSSQIASGSGTSTPSESLSGSVTGTSSPTGSVSATPSQSATPSATLTATRTQTLTRTPSQTQSPSITSTLTSSGSRTPSTTQSRTETPTPSQSRSPTLSASQSATGSVSLTPSLSGTPSSAPTQSGSGTPSSSMTASASGTLTATASGSSSRTRTASGTGTRSASATPSVTQGATSTRTSTASGTRTPSATGSRSGAASGSDSVTSTSTASASQTQSDSATGTASASASPSGAATSSGSGTLSQSASPSESGTSSASSSPSQSVSRSQGESASQSPSGSSTGTVSLTRTRSGTLTSSRSQTQSRTPSGSRTRSRTGTRSQTPTASATLTPSRTRTSSQGSSVSQTSTPSGTDTSTVTQSTSQAASRSATGSPSASQTTSQASTPTRSVSRSATLTVSATGTSSQSDSASPSSSGSGLPTPSSSGTRSGTSSRTASRSRTASPTGSRSGARTLSSSRTPTPTLTPSRTATRTGTGSASAQASASASLTASVTQGGTASMTGSSSGTPSPSGTRSGSASGSATCTPSTSGSASRSVSSAPSSLAPGASPSTSRSISASTSSSASASVTPSKTQSRSAAPTSTQARSVGSSASPSPAAPTRSSTASRTPTLTRSPTSSRTRSPSSTQTASTSVGSSRSPSVSATGTRSQSASPSVSATQTATSSQASTASGTASPGSSASPSRTQTGSGTPSSSPIPYELSFGGELSSGLVLSDSYGASTLTLSLNRCPGVRQQRLVSATCVGGNLSSSALTIVIAPGNPQQLACDALPAPVELPYSVSAVAAFRAPAATGTLDCRLSGSDGSSMGDAAVPVTVLATLWPIWEDAVAVSLDGTFLSSTLGYRNGTGALIAAACAFAASNQSAAVEAAAAANVTACTIGAALTSPELILAAVMAEYGGSALPTTSTLANASASASATDVDVSTSTFSLTLTGSTLLVLRATTKAFSNQTRATVGNASCSPVLSSADGQWFFMRTPSKGAICGTSDSSSDGDCGLHALTVTNPSEIAATETSSGGRALLDTAVDVSALLGSALSCPPFCPGFLSSGIIPIAKAAGFVPGVSQSGALPVPLSETAFATTSIGFYYVEACSKTGLFTDPTTGACSNASDPRSLGCAFGSGDSCVQCMPGGLCPGGLRSWPRTGYYSAAQNQYIVTPCTPPDPEQRCLGWNIAAGRTQCGAAYRQGSFMCETCAVGSYAPGDGSCATCPVIKSSWERYRGLVGLLAGVVAFAVVIYLALLLFIRVVGGSVAGGLKHIFILITWSLQTIQVVSQVARVASPTLPPLMRAIYQGVSLIQLQGILLPPACTGAYAFETEVGIMAAALGAWMATLVAFAFARGRLRVLGRLTMTVSLLLYPTSAGAALGLLSCQNVVLNSKAVAALDGGGGYQMASARALVSVPLLVSDPFFVCFAGSHRPAGYLAIATIICFIASVPIAVMILLACDPWLRKTLADEGRPLPGDFFRSYFDRIWPRGKSKAKYGEAIVVPATEPRLVPAEATTDHDAEDPKSPEPVDLSQPDSEVTSTAGVSGVTPQSDKQAESATAAATTSQMAIVPDPLLGPFLGDSGYSTRFWWFRLVDLLATLTLAALQAFLPRPVLVSQLSSKLLVTTFVVVLLLFLMIRLRPHAIGHEWKLPVRTLLLITSLSCAALNASLAALDLGLETPGLAASVVGGSYVIFIIFILTAVTLVVGFGSEMYRAAKAEEAAKALKLAAARALLAAKRAEKAAREQAEREMAEREQSERDKAESEAALASAMQRPVHATTEAGGDPIQQPHVNISDAAHQGPAFSSVVDPSAPPKRARGRSKPGKAKRKGRVGAHSRSPSGSPLAPSIAAPLASEAVAGVAPDTTIALHPEHVEQPPSPLPFTPRVSITAQPATPDAPSVAFSASAARQLPADAQLPLTQRTPNRSNQKPSPRSVLLTSVDSIANSDDDAQPSAGAPVVGSSGSRSLASQQQSPTSSTRRLGRARVAILSRSPAPMLDAPEDEEEWKGGGASGRSWVAPSGPHSSIALGAQGTLPGSVTASPEGNQSGPSRARAPLERSDTAPMAAMRAGGGVRLVGIAARHPQPLASPSSPLLAWADPPSSSPPLAKVTPLERQPQQQHGSSAGGLDRHPPVARMASAPTSPSVSSPAVGGEAGARPSPEGGAGPTAARAVTTAGPGLVAPRSASQLRRHGRPVIATLRQPVAALELGELAAPPPAAAAGPAEAGAAKAAP